MDCFSFILQEFNPFFVEHKFDCLEGREYLNMLWENVYHIKLYSFASFENFKIFNQIDNTFQKTNTVFKRFVENDENLSALKRYFQLYSMTYQHIFSILFPKYYTQNNIFGVQNKTNFTIHYKGWMDSKYKIKKENFQLSVVPTIDLTKQ